MSNRKSKVVETNETVPQTVPEITQETGGNADAIPAVSSEEGVNTEVTQVDNSPEETVPVEKKHAGKALEVAKNYGVKTVWSTGDGTYWATTEEKRKRLPTNRGEIVAYSFPD